jgi:hypothetical protein
MARSKAFLTIRVDNELRDELRQASELERRSLSALSRLLLEYAWAQYLKAGSIRELLSPQDQTLQRSDP